MERLGRRYHRRLGLQVHLPLILPNIDTPLEAFSESAELGLHEVELILVFAAEFDFWDLNDGATSLCPGAIITIFGSFNRKIIFSGAFW